MSSDILGWRFLGTICTRAERICGFQLTSTRGDGIYQPIICGKGDLQDGISIEICWGIEGWSQHQVGPECVWFWYDTNVWKNCAFVY